MRKGSRRMSDNLARTIRDFNGLGVRRFPSLGELPKCGVYALYCTADKGIYGRYGQGVNDCRYDVPVYVGCSIPSVCCHSFAELSLRGQLEFWRSAFCRSIDLDPKDFGFRWHEFAKPTDDLKFVRAFRNLYHPVWNEVFDETLSPIVFLARWAECHDLRFQPRNQSAEARCMRMAVQDLLRKVG